MNDLTMNDGISAFTGPEPEIYDIGMPVMFRAGPRAHETAGVIFGKTFGPKDKTAYDVIDDDGIQHRNIRDVRLHLDRYNILRAFD